MKKMIFTFSVLTIVLASCNLGEASKKQTGKFNANGVEYNADEDHVTVDYNPNNSNLLDIVLFTGESQTFASALEVNLTRIDETVPFEIGNEAFYYKGANTSIYYTPISGTWKITSHKEGNPATRHTEGEFEFTAVNPYTPFDTVHVTEGHFYVNNY